ncbi:MAG TPA: TetR/AcrR family transcriptional regulator [Candidatus Limnocylindrales bacterium]|nr:TetR/AcrR family transcriptional regulator [Candidatus Limnocylindrales bacterium]
MSPAGAPGRPRAELDDGIFAATLRLLEADGYQALTMGAVAAEAGIGKPTLYRRFGSKADLVAAAITGLGGSPAERPPLPEDTRAALSTLLAGTARAVATPGAMTVMGSLLAQARTDPALLAAFRESLFRPQHDVVHATIRAGIGRGDVRPDVDIEALDAMLFGALLARTILGEAADEVWARRVVDAAWPAIGTAG